MLLLPRSILLWGLLLSTAVLAAPPLAHQLVPRQTCNTATNRQCWTSSPAFSINTDYEVSTPSTGVTRTVWIILISCRCGTDCRITDEQG